MENDKMMKVIVQLPQADETSFKYFSSFNVSVFITAMTGKFCFFEEEEEEEGGGGGGGEDDDKGCPCCKTSEPAQTNRVNFFVQITTNKMKRKREERKPGDVRRGRSLRKEAFSELSPTGNGNCPSEG
jgi:hypothetical protein